MIVALFIRCIHNLLHTLSQSDVMPRIGDCCMVESFDGLAIMENLGKNTKKRRLRCCPICGFPYFCKVAL